MVELLEVRILDFLGSVRTRRSLRTPNTTEGSSKINSVELYPYELVILSSYSHSHLIRARLLRTSKHHGTAPKKEARRSILILSKSTRAILNLYSCAGSHSILNPWARFSGRRKRGNSRSSPFKIDIMMKMKSEPETAI
jgi:hypothetical protein